MRESNSTKTLSVVDTDSKVTATNETMLPRMIDLFEMDLAGRWIRQLPCRWGKQPPCIPTPAKAVGAHG